MDTTTLPADLVAVARKRCGCVSMLAATSHIASSVDTRRDLWQMIAAGGTVEQMTADEARSLDVFGCTHAPVPIASPPAPRPVIVLPEPVLPSKWKCLHCYEVHDDEDEARECCPNEIREIVLCPLCGDEHRDVEAAIECCGWDPASGPPPPTKAEMEAAGQLRLIE